MKWYSIHKIKQGTCVISININFFFLFVIDTEISAFKKNTLLKPQEPHHSLSTSKTICKNPSQNFFFYLQPPRAKSSSQLQSGSRGAEKWFILPLSIQAPASPPELPGGAGAHHLWQRGAIHHGDRSHSPLFRQCEHLVTFRLLQAGNEFESGPKKDTGWLIHTDFSLIKIISLVPNLQFATYERYLKENTIEEPFRKQRKKPAPRWTHWYQCSSTQWVHWTSHFIQNNSANRRELKLTSIQNKNDSN